MNLSRIFLLFLAGCCVLQPQITRGQSASPFELSKQYSAEMVITPGPNSPSAGKTMTTKVYNDNGKVRSEMEGAGPAGMSIISIVRPDQQKVYMVMVQQKMIMETPYDPAKIKNPAAAAEGGKFESMGSETVEGVVCTKYKVTAKDGKVFFFWVDTAKKIPVKMMPEDGSVTIVWKNFVTGPQDPLLFEPPPGYQTMNMPNMPHMPGGAGQ